MESLYLLFLVFFILVFIFPFTFKLNASFDFIKNKGAIAISKIFVAKIERKGKDILLITKKKNENVNLEVGEKQLKFIKYFKKEIQNKVKIRKLNVYSKIGIDDAFLAAMASSFFSVSVGITLSRFKTRQPTASFVHYPVTLFDENHCAVALTLRVAVSFFDILYSFFMAILKSRNDKKHENNL